MNIKKAKIIWEGMKLNQKLEIHGKHEIENKYLDRVRLKPYIKSK